ncbi:hypothetical protein KUL25_10365 [Rhodobacteraceae bacterium N5(2021)]|uniref:Uncharacterized protein n=1 Tax=Gymnodinialimonas phycosphaerae TaxID=2841589 RepID=A0A975TYP2_9RHOB|nr:hypothetical protein [Gymnodinialimonas phycosphaerae]MBY4893168.1 hypothetical protein [Gymnodinialimonas phycosphaerae]
MRARDGWHITRDGDTLTVSRKRTARFDLAEVTFLPGEDLVRSRIAHQIRQDMWRKLQRLRGFCPAVRVTAQPGGVAILAGGAVEGTVTDRARTAIADLLGDPALRTRWVANARRR